MEALSELGAEPKRDSYLRAAAEAVVAEIFGLITEDPQGFIESIAEDGRATAILQVGAKRGSDLRKLGVPGRFKFYIAFAGVEEGDGAAAAFTARDRAPRGEPKEAIVVYVLPQGAQILAIVNPVGLFNEISKRLQDNPDVLLHEATHMLDHLRGKRYFTKLHREPGQAQVDWGAYISTPEEFNAFFQQAVYQLRSHLMDTPASEVAKILSSFESFRDEADRMWAMKSLRSGVTRKWEKKLDARLWQTFEYWRREIEPDKYTKEAEAFRDRRKKKRK